MNRFGVIVLTLTLLCTATLPGCGARGEVSEAGEARLRLIVKPASGGADPTTEAGLARLSLIAGVPLDYVRQLSGGAHLLTTRDVVAYERIRSILDRLSADAGIDYVEEDRRIPTPRQP
jgi:hypothetical protein